MVQSSPRFNWLVLVIGHSTTESMKLDLRPLPGFRCPNRELPPRLGCKTQALHIRYPIWIVRIPWARSRAVASRTLAAVGGAGALLGAVLRSGSLRVGFASMTASALLHVHGNGVRGRACFSRESGSRPEIKGAGRIGRLPSLHSLTLAVAAADALLSIERS